MGFGAVVLITLFMYKTRPGLMIRAAGEHPKAVDSVGLSVTGIRYAATMAGAVIIGFGGMYLSMGILSFFSEEMVTGRGYIALAAVIFGRYTAAGPSLRCWCSARVKRQYIGSRRWEVPFPASLS